MGGHVAPMRLFSISDLYYNMPLLTDLGSR